MPSRILLINPPIYDFRFDWSRWHQPIGLLQVGSVLRARGDDVQLIDCLQSQNGDRIQRKKLGTVPINGSELVLWQFGWSWEKIDKKLQELLDSEWEPNTVYITCMMTVWWQSVRDFAEHIRKHFPHANIFIGGQYPSLAPEHVMEHIPNVRFDSALGEKAKNEPSDFSLYEKTPYFAGIVLNSSRSAKQIVDDIEKKKQLGVREFAFFDDEIPGENSAHFTQVLDLIIRRELDIKLRALGNLSAKSLTKELIMIMRRAGYRQIFLRDDIALNPTGNGYIDSYERGIELLIRYGDYRPRTEDLTAMVLVGVPGENLDPTVERLTRLAHVVGSVNLVPYQPTPGTFMYEKYKQHLPSELEKQNGKFFPFAKLNGVTFADYHDLTRLATLLNSKYHSVTFDFLGDPNTDHIAQMVRQSIANETWKPRLRERIALAPK